MTKLVNKEALQEIVEMLQTGEVVAFPTDTVYGVGVIYSNYDAVVKMKLAKGRDESKPFPLMVANVEQMQEVAELSDRDIKIAKALTPGALTMVLKKKDVINDEFTNGKSTIAIRIPDDSFVLQLLEIVGPMFVTSANISGQPACNTGSEVMASLNDRIALVVDGEATSHTASTIIDCTKEDINLLREGDIKLADIRKALSE